MASLRLALADIGRMYPTRDISRDDAAERLRALDRADLTRLAAALYMHPHTESLFDHIQRAQAEFLKGFEAQNPSVPKPFERFIDGLDMPGDE